MFLLKLLFFPIYLPLVLVGKILKGIALNDLFENIFD